MTPGAHAHQVFSVVEFSGVVIGAVGGALEVRRKSRYQYDVIGLLGLALISALGGGIMRDVIISTGPPLAFTDTTYLVDALIGALIGYLLIHLNRGFDTKTGEARGRLALFVNIIDAASMGLFSVAGATRAVNAGLSFLPALLLGVVTAIGGGSLRDVCTGRTPRVFERGEPYAIASVFSILVFFLCEWLRVPRSLSTAIAIAAGFLLRMLEFRFGWRTPSLR
jgi:uncharacterized membrane protein YeiH